MKFLRHTSLSDQIAEYITEEIVFNRLLPGEKLNELALSKQLKVSTNSLREAFKIMESRSLVVIKARRGSWVCGVSEKEAEELYDFVFLLFSKLAARAATNWQEGELDDLVEMLPQLTECHERNDIAGAHKLVFRFIPKMMRFARNDYMAKTILSYMPLLKRYSYIALQEERSEFAASLATFNNLLVNVLKRDAAAAEEKILQYGHNQCQIVLRALKKRMAETEKA
ncbi:MAG TPA: GntR family transcriptional regulator [Alcanivoracaceae bacterium]|nr:GntR family transcriptional regulator [Alcanivoracaceae bacterium]